jgi:broad specificity phosphatase PhoE
LFFKTKEKEAGKMEDTIVYLIRHAETVDENGIRNTDENFQMINEKEILSVEGEEQAKELSKNKELHNLDAIWSSSYTRAKATAKYIAYENKVEFNLDGDLSERKLGNLKELGEFMKDKASRDPSQEQLLDRTFRTLDGESAEQTRERMNRFFNKLLKDYQGKRIAVISHGGSIKFFLLNWCAVNKDVKLVYNENTILNIKSPCLLKLTFKKNELVNIEQIS